MWLNSLKIALIEKDVNKLHDLADCMPSFQDNQERKTAVILINQAIELLEGLRDETAISMKRLKKHINFLQSTQAPQVNRLDIKS